MRLLRKSKMRRVKNPIDVKIITPAYRVFLQKQARAEEEQVQNSFTAMFEKARLSGILDLSKKDLTTVPNCVYNIYKKNKKNAIEETITKFEQLYAGMSIFELNLSKNKIQHIPADIGNIEPLTRLRLNNNNISSLPNTIDKLRRLASVDLSNNKLTELPCNFFNLVNLRNLVLSKNSLKQLDDGIGKLVYLEQLDLRNNKLSAIPNCLGNLKQLKELLLSFNYLTTLPPSIGDLCSLDKLEVTNNNLTCLPMEIGKLLHLRYLCLQHNQIKNLVPIIGCARISELYVANNLVQKLPLRFGQNLIVLNMRRNKLTELPRDVGNMKYLIRLDISHNKIQKLPCTLGTLKFLLTLNFEGNPINAIYRDLRVAEEPRASSLITRSHSAHKFKMISSSDHTEIFLQPANHKGCITAMKTEREFAGANFASRSLSELPIEFEFICQCAMDLDLMVRPNSPLAPPFIQHFMNIKRMNLSHNNLRDLPLAFSVLTKLNELNISVNQFKHIPAGVYKLHNLKVLNASNNKLISLDFSASGFEALENLRVLRVRANKITKIPVQLIDMKNLITLDILNNPLLQPPRNVIMKGTNAIKNYLKFNKRLM